MMSQQPGMNGSQGVSSYGAGGANAMDMNSAAAMTQQNRMQNLNFNDMKAKVMQSN